MALSGAARDVYGYFNRLYGPIIAAGIVGNTQQESSNRPGAAGGGLIQGQGGRTSRGSLAQQLAGVRSELEGPERGTLKALKGARSAKQAARIFSEQFERPSEPMLGNRERYAQEALSAFGRFKGGPVGSSSRQVPGTISTQQELGGPSPDDLTRAVAEVKQLIEPQRESLASRAQPARPQFAAGPPLPEGAPATPAGIVPQKPGPSPEALAQRILSSLSPEATSRVVSTGPRTVEGPETASAPKDVTKAKGVVDFAGKKVAAWIAPALKYAQAHGWKGTVESGYRSFAEQKRIYDSGVRPAAVPGTSNHEGDVFPRGAVDVSEAAALAKILERSPYKKLLVWAGAKDPVHFSHPHGGSY